ncbi:MAG: transcriptional repressor [Candidatus Dormibacteria bacterium]
MDVTSPHRVEDVGAALRRAGLRATPQRRAVLTVVLGEAGHWSADEIWQRLTPRDGEGLDRSTVYRVLNDLGTAGLVSQVRLADGVARFEPREEPHLHLLCSACGATRHVLAPDLLASAEAVAAAEGFNLSVGSLLLAGVCADCAAPAG